MPHKNKAWGEVISKEYPDKQKEYHKYYMRVWRYNKKVGTSISPTREAYKAVKFGEDTPVMREIRASRGVTNIDQLKVTHAELAFAGFIDYWKDVKIAPSILKSKAIDFGKMKEFKIGDAVKMMREGKITVEQFADLVSEIKKSPYYYSYGSF